MNFPFYSTVCEEIVYEGTKLVHPTTGEGYGGTDWGNSSKLSEIGAVPLRLVEEPPNYLLTGWEIVDDPENPGGKVRRPTGFPLRVEYPPEDYVATGWEIVDDPENPGGKLKRPTGTEAKPDQQLSGPTADQRARISDKGFRPANVLFYYGYPNSFNSAVNGWSNEKVAQDMAGYDIVVLGAGVEDPAHADYANTQVILPRVRTINPNMKIFGYVTAAQTIANFKTKVDRWNTLQAGGIFIDEAGYDFGKTRLEFNERVVYVHGQTTAKVCFVNSWNPDHVLGLVEDASYPNATWNSVLMPSKLLSTDWLLLESFPINTTAYSGTGGYEAKADWLARGQKAVNLRRKYGVELAAVGLINDDNAEGQSLHNFGYTSALMFALEAWGTSSNNYGASTAQVKFWTRPDVNLLREIYEVEPAIKSVTGDADAWLRYCKRAKMLVDFSTSAQISTIEKR